MEFNISEAAKEKIIIVAHRGTAGGNIPCNTLASYEIALKQGADMIEIDVEMSRDGKLFIFHPGMEPHHLDHCKEGIWNMTAEEISELRFVNYDRAQTQFGLNTFDEVLENFKGRCYINVDKFWGHPREIYEAIKRHNMTDQIVVKSAPSEKVFTVLKEIAPNLPYMPVVRDTHPLHEELLASSINYIGAEVLFAKDDAEVASPAFIEQMHQDGKLVWANSIIYDYKEQLTGGHSDDTALCRDMDLGWGWLAERGFDMIQTDWAGMLVDYLKEKNLLYRKQR
ncbi:MAG: glycerophosphodiester phosphodiesterase family protein [Lachnospiraceae bacterium]|nr:glycerophosphodiester phosphodiesterase family protein [Lachnospiraceae bacterium]